MICRTLATSILTVATAAALSLSAQAAGGEKDIVVDAPDVQKLNLNEVSGFRTMEVVGTDVYGNAGKRIGEVQDFLMSGSGHLYAVIDIQDGPIERYIDLTDGDVVVIPWDQLRVRDQTQQGSLQ